MSDDKPPEEEPKESKPPAPRCLSLESGEWIFVAVATFAVGLWGLWDGFIAPNPEKSVPFNRVLTFVMFAACIASIVIIKRLKRPAPAESADEEKSPADEPPEAESQNP